MGMIDATLTNQIDGAAGKELADRFSRCQSPFGDGQS